LERELKTKREVEAAKKKIESDFKETQLRLESEAQQVQKLTKDAKKTDKFKVLEFDHLEFYVLDAKCTMKSLKVGIGMEIIAESKQETKNQIYTSYVLKTGDVKWVVTAPYLRSTHTLHPTIADCPHPHFDVPFVKDWVTNHGNGVAAIGIKVENAEDAFNKATGKGQTGDDWAKPWTPPVEIFTKDKKGSVVLAEVFVYEQTVVRFVEYRGEYNEAYLPGYERVEDPTPLNYGIKRMDHVVGNVWNLEKTCEKLNKWFGFHKFASFTKDQIATEFTSLNSTVMANDTESVLFPINEAVDKVFHYKKDGVKKRKVSQIKEYLRANNGEGVQHIALYTTDVLSTVVRMQQAIGGFDFIPASENYYKDPVIINRMMRNMDEAQQQRAKKIGLLVDEDAEGVLLQIFTKPLFDRATLFVEIIERMCHIPEIKFGCGGFGNGNFKSLFESIERMQIKRNAIDDVADDDGTITTYVEIDDAWNKTG